VTIEKNSSIGGAGAGVCELLASEGFQLPLLQLRIPDRFIGRSRESCLAAAGLDLAGLSASIGRWWALQIQERVRSVSGM
jgi:1-deoxy-D-xylulose-5-phosphate synthase